MSFFVELRFRNSPSGVGVVLLLLDLRQIFNVLAVVAERDVLRSVSLFLTLRQIRLVGRFISEVQHDLLGDGRLEFRAVRARMIAATMITPFPLAAFAGTASVALAAAASSLKFSTTFSGMGGSSSGQFARVWLPPQW